MKKSFVATIVTALFGLSLFASAAGFASYCPMPDCSECNAPATVQATPQVVQNAHAPSGQASGCCSVPRQDEDEATAHGSLLAFPAPIAQVPAGPADCDCDLMVDGLDAFGGSAQVSLVSPHSASAWTGSSLQAAPAAFDVLRDNHAARAGIFDPGRTPLPSCSLRSQSILIRI